MKLLPTIIGSAIAARAETNATVPLDPADMPDIHDIKPIIEPGMDWRWAVWVAAAVLLVFLVALAWWLWRRRKAPVGTPPLTPLPPAEQEAHAALDALAAAHPMAGKPFYFRLSALLRRYVERRYDIAAAEMTLEELLPQVDRLPLDSQLALSFKALCRRAEPVKFADAAADADRMIEDLQFARDFVDQTTPAPPDEGATTDKQTAMSEPAR